MRQTRANPATGPALLFTRPTFHSHRERTSGVYAAAIERGWQIQQVAEVPTKELITKCMRLWNPIGCLIDPSVITQHLDGGIFKMLPTVLMGRGEGHLKWEKFDCSFQDCQAPVDMAYAELSRLKPAGFAFVGDPAKPFWSIERGLFFKESIGDKSAFSEYAGPDPDTVRGRRAMVKWIGALPNPCGCFLAADHLAASFYAAAAEAGRKIGADLPTVGVDDDERICKSMKPTLTSVKPDFFQSGVNAIRLLEQRLANPSQAKAKATYGVLGIVRRESTLESYKDIRVTKAMSLIGERGCGKLSVAEVAQEMGCCSHLALILFKRHTGMTVLDAIRKTRLEKTFALLKNPRIPLDAIPFQCGYATAPAYLKTYFKRVTGLTMREWRKKNTQ